MRKLLFFIFMAIGSMVQAQDKYTVSGTITDSSSGEELMGATVFIQETKQGMVTNAYGFYSLTCEPGTYTLVFRYLGFNTKTIRVKLNKNLKMNVELREEAFQTEEALVTAKSIQNKVENKKIGVVSMDIKTIKEIPVIFGEVDVLKTITFLPGIQQLGEANSGFSVRGGSQDQNLILLDEATVYNASHLLGFFSVFNGDAIRDVEVYKGGIPATYGGRLASLVDIRMKEGNNKKYMATGGIGTISSRLTIEGPIKKDTASFLVSGRRSYADIFLPLANNEAATESKLFFYDLNVKANYKISDKDRLFLSGYFGRDVFGFSDLFGLKWGNTTGTFRWNHVLNQKLFSNVSFVFSDFNYGFEFKFADNANFGNYQRIQDMNLKVDFTNYIGTGNKLSFGIHSTHHKFNPGEFKALNEETEETLGQAELSLPTKKALETAIYVDHDYEFSKKFTVRYGLRIPMFNNMGSATEYNFRYDAIGTPIPTDTLNYNNYEIYNTFFGVEPRLSASYNMNSLTSLKFSYNRMYQFIQQASNTASALPVNQWFSAGINVKPQIADQVAVGLFRNFEGWETSFETYYKWMQNQIDYRDNASLFFNEYLDGEFLFGKARSYGAEVLIKRTEGKLTGFLSYTLSKTERQIQGINNNEWYRDNNDRRNNVSLILTYKFNKRMVLSGTFVYVTGAPLTSPVGVYRYDGKLRTVYGGRNNDKIPDYHRADLGFTLHSKEKENKRLKSSWNFSIYNLYGRENPFTVIFEEKTVDTEQGPVGTGETQAKQIALFKFIPAITWNFEF